MIPTVPASLTSLQPWVDAGVFGPAELHAADVITRADTTANELVHLGAVLALWAPLHGHVCLDLQHADSLVRAELAELAGGDEFDEAADIGLEPNPAALPWPPVERWLGALTASSIVRVTHTADPEPVLDNRPLVLCGHRLYTQRQWVDECIVAASLRSRANSAVLTDVSPAAAALLDQLLPPTERDEINLQHSAAHLALTSRLAVVVGGPGTGKTHTVARLLAVLLANAVATGEPIRIALAAPTGKAAARLREAIVAAASLASSPAAGSPAAGSPAAGSMAAGSPAAGSTPALPATIAAQLADLPATTLHRLLGSAGLSRTRFRHNVENPLPYDIVVVDETSMVALPLMARLLEAVRADARLILVGDPDQLESIDVGAVLADINDAAESALSPLSSHVVRLRRPRRQQEGSPIGPLSDAIREGRADDVLHLLRAGSVSPDTNEPLITFIESDDAMRDGDAAGIRAIVSPPLLASMAEATAGHADTALGHLAQIRVLCAHRRGPHGAQNWNDAIESWLLGATSHPRDYPGRALLVTHNDARTRLSNGDTGVVVLHPDGVRAAFRIAGEVHEFAPSQLERVETAFAMTIHKSQGSEYPTVVVVLPPATSPLIGRELLYTAITRTTRRLIVVGTAEAVIAAVQTPARRITGLPEALA